MRRSYHAGSSSAALTATPAQAGGETAPHKAGIPALQGREDVNRHAQRRDLAATQGEQAATAQDALSLLFRLAGGGS